MNAPVRKAFDETAMLQREIEAAKAIREQIATLAQGDEDFTRDVIEGETNIREIIASLVANEAEDDAMVAGIGSLINGLQARKKRIEGRIEYRRAMIANGLDIAGLEKLETPGGTVSVRAVPPKLIVQDEAAIPAKYWTAGAPTLDKKALIETLKEQARATVEASKIEDPVVRAAVLASFAPYIPGAVLSNGGQTIAIRR